MSTSELSANQILKTRDEVFLEKFLHKNCLFCAVKMSVTSAALSSIS